MDKSWTGGATIGVSVGIGVGVAVGPPGRELGAPTALAYRLTLLLRVAITATTTMSPAPTKKKIIRELSFLAGISDIPY